MRYSRASRIRENASSCATSAGMIPQVMGPKPANAYTQSSKKKKKPAVKKKTNKIEHIQGEMNRVSFMHNGQQFTGWVEKRSAGKYDVAVVRGDFTVVKSVTKKDVLDRVRAAADKLSKSKSSFSTKKKNPDVLLPTDADEE